MAELTIHEIDLDGLDTEAALAAVDHVNGDTVDQGAQGRVFLLVKNAAGTEINGTVAVALANETKQVPGWGELSASAVSVQLAQNDVRAIGPFPRNAFGLTLTISYAGDANEDLEIAAIRLPKG